MTVERRADTWAIERLGLLHFLVLSDEARPLSVGDVKFFAAQPDEGNVFNDVFVQFTDLFRALRKAQNIFENSMLSSNIITLANLNLSS